MTTRSVILRGRRSAPATTTPTEQLDALWELVQLLEARVTFDPDRGEPTCRCGAS